MDGNALDPSVYNTSVAGKITFTPANSTLLQTAGTKHIVISVSGVIGGVIFPTFVDVSVDQVICASTTTNINNINDNESVQIYKNSTNRLTINCNADLKSDASVSVYNVVGKKLLSTHLTNAVTVLENSFQSGVYVVSVVNAGKTLTKMIVLN